MRNWPLATLVALALGGCSLPHAGPTTGEIEATGQTENQTDGIELIDLDADTVRVIEARRAPPLAGRFADRRPSPVQTVGVGDTLVVSIYEASAGGLFSTSTSQLGGGTKSVTLPPQIVGSTGSISVPYAGSVPVNGRTPEQIEKAIVEKLRDKAIEPQAVVTIQSARSNLVTVNGDVGAAGRVSLSPRGERLMDVIAAAGGTKGNSNELFIRLTRDGVTATAPVRTVLDEPAQNIWARPGDQVFVFREPQSFTALGATGRSGNFNFEYDRMTMAQAVGAAAGLNDERAEPAGVFIYRQEQAEVVCAIKGEKPCIAPATRRTIVYRLNLRKANGFALAQRIPVRNRDVLYVANAEGAELTKVLRLVSAAASVVNTTTAAGARINDW